jgi:hypothetical protein
MTENALRKMVDTINNNDSRVRYGVDHRKDFPPKGRLENAELIESKDYYYVEADLVEYENSEIVPWDNTLIKEYLNDQFTFAEIESDEITDLSISIDPHNFSKTFKDVKEIESEIKKATDLELKLQLHGRKAELPDPEVIFSIGKTFLLYYLLKPTAKKIGEEISEEIVKDGKKFLLLVEKTLLEIFYRCIPKTRPVSVVFNLPGKPHIELIARTRDQKLVLKGLSKKRISKIKEDIKGLSKNVEIAKVQFLLSDKGHWKFNYLITKRGETIGKKVAFERREKRFEMIKKLNKKNGR